MKVIDLIEELQKYDPSTQIILCSVGDVETEKVAVNVGLPEAIDVHGIYFQPIGDGFKPAGNGNPEMATIFIKQL